ncbi:MAG: enoyl-CoA hydratase [Herminiimonas sp.]|nr:enoyl-CoA hydratase [Herminiimonas sp.]
MSIGRVHLTVREHIASILIDRPEARNAMTWAMYKELADVCAQISGDPNIRVATIRGAGGEAFVAGTDIEQFQSFTSGEDGISYEKAIDAMIETIECLPMPTVAIVEGWAIGGGLAISAACDFRIATPNASFGVPIARTLGNCLSMSNNARVLAAFGVGRAKRMLLLAETIDAREAKECGFVIEIADASEIDATAEVLCAKLAKNAPVTMQAEKEAIRRIVAEGLPNGDDLVRMCYGSRDFKIGVSAFMEKKRPEWAGS